MGLGGLGAWKERAALPPRQSVAFARNLAIIPPFQWRTITGRRSGSEAIELAILRARTLLAAALGEQALAGHLADELGQLVQI